MEEQAKHLISGQALISASVSQPALELAKYCHPNTSCLHRSALCTDWIQSHSCLPHGAVLPHWQRSQLTQEAAWKAVGVVFVNASSSWCQQYRETTLDKIRLRMSFSLTKLMSLLFRKCHYEAQKYESQHHAQEHDYLARGLGAPSPPVCCQGCLMLQSQGCSSSLLFHRFHGKLVRLEPDQSTQQPNCQE